MRELRNKDKNKEVDQDAMNTREAIYHFQYSEKMKTGLITGISLYEQVQSLQDERERAGGKKILIGYLEWLRHELRVALNVIGTNDFLDLDHKLMNIIESIQMSSSEEVLKSFSEAISLSTTSCQTSLNVLMENNLV